MQELTIYQNLISYLKAAIGLLNTEETSQLRKDVIAICDYFEDPSFRVAVFAPFNYGKSTLLNALLGNKTLPIDLIPTTGAAIYVSYGDELKTIIKLKDGTEISDKGTEILKRYAVLDDQRCMKKDVISVQVFCPHPFLKTGVEFLDLPGTNDQEAQDTLVQDKLLTADLIIQVLDARKLMTLGERENLRDWLLDRGIKTVVFVVNFLNLLELEEQKQIHNRLRFVAESFRAELPAGVSNVYRVDALPALRSVLKGDMSAAHTAGLSTFESALQTIVQHQKEKIEVRFPRLQVVANQIINLGEKQKQILTQQLEESKQKKTAKAELLSKGEKILRQGLQQSIDDFKSWLYLPNLLSKYQKEVKQALQDNDFKIWEEYDFKTTVVKYQSQIEQWVKKAREFFDNKVDYQLSISFPSPPQITWPELPQSYRRRSSDISDTILEIAGYFFKKIADDPDISDESFQQFERQVTQVHNQAAKDYLTRFSQQAFLALEEYEKKIEQVMKYQVSSEPIDTNQSYYQLQLLSNLLDNIQQELEMLEKVCSH